MESTTIDNACDNLTNIKWSAIVIGNDAEDFIDRIGWIFRCLYLQFGLVASIQVLNDVANHAQSTRFIFGIMISHSRLCRVDICTTQVLSTNLFAGCGFDQRWTCKEDCSISFDDN